MSETLIVMAAVMVVGILPIIAIAVLAIRAMRKALDDIGQALNERITTFDEGVDDINELLAEQEQQINDTIKKLK